ncbi:DUF1129 domain-containing protein [Halobacteria archaeon AArc-dxtr1]|nr:DUF1129 domain-containing protein [Halobacteria archaeon AArc-dxtr1]
MWIDRSRIAIVAIAVVGLALGFTVGYLDLDVPILGVVLGFGAIAGIAMYYYYRTQQRTGAVDERYVRIQGRASMGTATVLLVGVALIAATLSFTEMALPVEWLLWGLVFGGIIVDEALLELYRRRM